MAVIKCKMCGGDLRIEEGSTVCECEYCGTRQTVPNTDSEKKLTLFSRAGRLLRGCEFDKAAGVFETLVADYPEEAEAYWGLVLCKYGIEYVDDPATGKKVPTCHRSSFDSVMKDPNFEQACENTDAVARRVYRDEARAIEELRKRIIEVSGKEEPYDVFISYKEKDENGERTQDSVLAQDIYRELTRDGLRVFFSRISLENKLGMEYEPYIFAALNSAKVMLVVGTDYENFDSVWVKNEWSRYLKLIAAGQKKTLIPVFRNMDAYDMPEEISRLAAQDMGKVGAMQDLVHAVEKLVGKKQDETAREPVRETVVVQQAGGPNTAALLKRGQQALEDGAWDKAREYYDQVLNMDAENAEAFFGLFLTGAKCVDEREYIGRVCGYPGERQKLSVPADEDRIEETVGKYALEGYLEEDELRKLFQYDLRYVSFTREDRQQRAEQQKKQIRDDRNYARAVRFAKGETAVRLDRFKADIVAGLDAAVSRAAEQETEAAAAKQKEYAAFLADAEKKAEELNRQAAEKREAEYQELCARADAAGTEKTCLAAAEEFRSRFPDFRDSAERIHKCEAEAERLRILAEKAAKETKERQKKAGIIAGIVAIVAIAAILIVTKVVNPGNRYKAAEALLAEGDKVHAAMAFGSLRGYKDSHERSLALWDEVAQREPIAAGLGHTVGLKADGTVVATKYTGDQKNYHGECDVSGWTDIVAIAAGWDDTVGLKADGTIVAVGGNSVGECDVSGWTDIVAIAAGVKHTVGLKADGRAVATKYTGKQEYYYGQCNVSGWANIVAISAAHEHTVGLKADGTVVAVGSNGLGRCDVSDWTDIVAIAAGGAHTVGLKADGTVVAVGYNEYGQCDVSGWTDIVAIAAGYYHTVGLKADGTVVAVGYNKYGQCKVSDWTDIVAIAAEWRQTVGLKADGSVVATEYTGDPEVYCGQCDVSDWTDIKLPNT